MKKKILLLPLLALALPACGPSSGGSATGGVNLSASIHEQSLQPFCMQESIAIVDLTAANIAFSGGAHIGGDVILMGPGASSFSGNGRIDGTLFISQSSQAHFSGNASANQISNQDLSAQANSIQNVISNLSTLAATQSFSDIGKGGKVIVGNGSVNVISVTGGIHLTGKDSLVFQGSASDLFVMNVQGDIAMSGQSSILISGGVLAKNILINNMGAGSGVALSGQGVVTGTIFAAQRGISVSGGGTVMGSLIVGGVVSISGQGQVIQPQAFCSTDGQVVVPQPTTTTTSTTSTTLPPTTTTVPAPTTTVPNPPATTTTLPPTTTTIPAPTTTTLPGTTDPTDPNPNWPPQCYENPMLCG